MVEVNNNLKSTRFLITIGMMICVIIGIIVSIILGIITASYNIVIDQVYLSILSNYQAAIIPLLALAIQWYFKEREKADQQNIE